MISYLHLVIIFVYFLIKVLSVVLSMLGTNLNHGKEMKSIKAHLGKHEKVYGNEQAASALTD